MRSRKPDAPPVIRGLQGVRGDEVLPWQSLEQRLGLGESARADASKRGLKSAIVGGKKITTGKWIMEFIAVQAAAQHGSGGNGTEGSL